MAKLKFSTILGEVMKILPGGGIVKQILAPGKTPEETEIELSKLHPLAQYQKSMARPRIAMGIVAVYLLGITIQWIGQIFGNPEIIIMPPVLIEFAKMILVAYIGSRGIEKVAESIFKKNPERQEKRQARKEERNEKRQR